MYSLYRENTAVYGSILIIVRSVFLHPIYGPYTDRIVRPGEFLNLLNDIVFFQPLTINQFTAIRRLQLNSLDEPLNEGNISLNFPDKTIQSIIDKSYHSG